MLPSSLPEGPLPVTLLQLAVLSLVQGITEFLPVSSSGHLVLASGVLGWPDQGLEIDIAVHGGTLLAVIAYFRRDVARLLRGFLPGAGAGERRLLAMLALATVPVGAAGVVLHGSGGALLLRDPLVIACATAGFGLLLLVADRSARTRAMERLEWKGALLIGLFQVLALVPGTSRAGITITAARFLGYRRRDCATLSMLLAIPVIAAAVALAAAEIAVSGNAALTREAALAAAMAFLSALVTIRLLMAWLRRASFTPFVVYRVVLGVALLGWLYL